MRHTRPVKKEMEEQQQQQEEEELEKVGEVPWWNVKHRSAPPGVFSLGLSYG